MTLQDKIKSIRTREAEFEGVPCRVKVYPEKQFRAIIQSFQGGEDGAIAAALSEQFLTEAGDPLFAADFLLSDDVPLCVITDLGKLFAEVNTGMYKKK